jgi:hypothetical protein
MSVSLPAMNDRGDLAFGARISAGGRTDFYLSSEGILSRILSTGDPAPEGGIFSSFDSIPAFNNNGEIAFVGSVFPSYRSGLYVGSGAFRRLVSSGDPAPGGGTFTSFVSSVSLNDSGQLLFSASVSAPGRSGIFLWSDGSVRAIAQTGDAAPGGETFFSFFRQQSLNASGQVAFDANLSSGSWGVFLFSAEIVSSIAQSGDPAPGGTVALADLPSLNDAGQVALRALVGARTGLYLFSQGQLSTIVLDGDPAPGGGTFAFVNFPHLGAQSQVAFWGGVAGSTGAFLATPQVAAPEPRR